MSKNQSKKNIQYHFWLKAINNPLVIGNLLFQKLFKITKHLNHIVKQSNKIIGIMRSILN